MSRFWSPVVHQLTPYVPGEQPKLDTLIKLNTNENPYGPSPKVLAAIRAATDDSLRLYPDPSGDKLAAAQAAPKAAMAGDAVLQGKLSRLSERLEVVLRQQVPGMRVIGPVADSMLRTVQCSASARIGRHCRS